MFRSSTNSDLGAIVTISPKGRLPFLDPVRFREDFALRRHRLEWIWLAEEDGRLTAVAAWWGLAQSTQPSTLTHVWVDSGSPDPAGLLGGLLNAAMTQFRVDGLTVTPEAQLDLPVDWESDAIMRADVATRRVALRSIGLDEWNERRQQEWTSDRPVPAGSGRLDYSAASDEEFLRVFRRVAVGSLDVLTRRSLAELGPDAQAQDDLDFYLSLPGDRSLWRVSTARDDAVVGFIIPSRSAYEASVSYLGVVPEHRGKRFVDDLLAEITRVHAAAGARRITGTTDSTNLPMLDAFARAGYSTIGTRLVVSQAAPPR